MKMRLAGVGAALGCALVAGAVGGVVTAPAVRAQERPAATSVPPLPAVNSWVYGWAGAIVAGTGGQDRLIRVSPDGRTRDVGPVPSKSTVIDVSHDARRIITKVALSDTVNRFLVWDSTTGGRYQVTITGATTRLSFGPNGGLVSVGEEAAGTVLRDRYGTPTKSYTSLKADGLDADVSPGGTTLSYEDNGYVKIASLTSGRVVRTVRNPQLVSCQVTGLWSDGSSKFFCTDIPGTTNTYTVSTATGVVTRRGSAGDDLGQVVPTTPLVGTQYWEDNHHLWDVSGSNPKPLSLTGPWGSQQVGVDLLGGRGSSAFALVSWQTGTGSTAIDRRTLVGKALPNGATTLLAGSGAADGRTILNAFVVDGLN